MEELSQIIEYVEFVNSRVRKYKDVSNLIQNDEVTPETINKALANYSNVNLALIGEYKRLKANVFKLELNYQEWWDAKFSEARKLLISEIESKTIKISVEEIKVQTRTINKEEYRDWQEKIFAAKEKVSFMLRMVDNWKKVDQILITLSHNMRSEMRTLTLESRINTDRDKVRRRTKVE
jgi:hypothetical protein